MSQALAASCLPKAAAAHSRRKPKDWYDIAFVLLHNDHGDARDTAARVRSVFGPGVSSLNSALADLKANFGNSAAQGTTAYVDQITLDHPDTGPASGHLRTPTSAPQRASCQRAPALLQMVNIVGLALIKVVRHVC